MFQVLPVDCDYDLGEAAVSFAGIAGKGISRAWRYQIFVGAGMSREIAWVKGGILEANCFDLARDLAGPVKGMPRDLATNPKYMDGFGQ